MARKGKIKTPLGSVKARKNTPSKANTQVHKDKKREAKKNGLLPRQSNSTHEDCGRWLI